MNHVYQVPDIIYELFHACVPSPRPELLPEHLRKDPVRGYGLFCFYQGLAMGLRLDQACHPD